MLSQHRKHQHGFTLIEAMIVILIVSILVGVAIPSFREAFATQRVKTAAKTLFTAVKQARSEAIRLNGICDVYVFPRTANDWADGLLVVAATAGTSLADVQSDIVDPITAAWTTYDSTTGAACTFTDNTATGNITYRNPLAHFDAQQYVDGTSTPAVTALQFNRMGRPPAAIASALSIGFCDDENLAQSQWTIQLDAAGLPRYNSDGSCP